MRYKIILILIISILIFASAGCIDNTETQEIVNSSSNLVDNNEIIEENFETFETQLSNEMEMLNTFLAEDQTDIKSYSIPTKFSRELANNSFNYGIKMGAITLSNHKNSEAMPRHAMCYVIVDDQFLIIEPQTDGIYTLENIETHPSGIYKHITIYPNAQLMPYYVIGKKTIDIDLTIGYNESDIIKNFVPVAG